MTKSTLLCQPIDVPLKHPALSTNPPETKRPALSIEGIEARRKKIGLSKRRLLVRAGLDQSSWWRGRRDGAKVKAGTLERLDRALRDFENGMSSVKTPPLWRAFFGFAFAIIAREQQLDYELAALFDFSAEKPNDPKWLKLARLRRIVIYLVTVEAQVPNAALARAIGCSRQNVKQARDTVELWRDDPATENLLERWGIFMREQPMVLQ